MTYRATRLADGLAVCIKELVYRRIGSFDVEERFRREAGILEQLDHPQVPNYVDDFVSGEGRTLGLYLVQELVEGESLAEELSHHRYDEKDVLRIVAEVADVLAYLHGKSPPVVHRDLKPANVMRRSSSGELVLVDFGSVKDSLREGTASTAGTFGYMAPEQLHGRATPATDLYGLGALAVALLSRQDPAELVNDDNELDWRSAINVGVGAEALLASMLEPVPGRRASDAGGVAKKARELIDSDVEALPAPVPVTRERAPGEPDALRSRSRAEQPPSSRFTAVLGGIGLAVVAAGILFTALRDRPARVPHGLVGVEFGMTEAMVKQKIPGLEPAPKAGFVGLAGNEAEGPPRLSGKTLLFDEPATCTFTFAVDDTLSKIDCLVDPLQSREAHQRTLQKLLLTLRKLYDTESSVNGETWTWKNPEARLWVRSDFEEQTSFLGPSTPKSVIEVANTWSEHDTAESKRYLERSKREAAQRKADRAAEVARRAKERAAEIERLRRAQSDGGKP